MAAQVNLPTQIQTRYDMVREFEEGTSRLTFDVCKQEWIFTAEVTGKITKIAATKIAYSGTIGAVTTGAVHGIIGGIISIGKSIWDGAWSGNLSLIKIVKIAGERVIEDAKAGAVHGAIQGSVQGAIDAYIQIVYKTPLVTVTRNEKASDKTLRIMDALFRKVANSNTIFCPISGKVFHLPVRTSCQKSSSTAVYHTFEFNEIMDKFEDQDTIRCPFPNCRNEIRKTKITLDVAMRMRVSDVMRRALSWLAAQISEEKEIDVDQREKFLSNHSKRSDLLVDEDEIVEKIQDRTLSGHDVIFLSHLVNKEIERYNSAMDNVFQKLSSLLVNDMARMGTKNYSKFQSDLLRWMENLTIDLSPLETV